MFYAIRACWSLHSSIEAKQLIAKRPFGRSTLPEARTPMAHTMC